jgi:hypothetical protein
VEGGDEEVDAALAAARAAFDSIRSRDDDPAKFRAVTQLADGFRRLGDEASAERRGVVTRYRDREQLKLAPLADEVGMSTTRLHQLISATKKEAGDA